ncbi:hypothetical protein Tco_0252625 [Tanacetum coccineum]
MSSAEAEYVALSASCAQVMWMRTHLKDYGFNYNKIPLYCDSQSAIAISCNPVQHSRTKHIHTRYHFIKEQVENGIIELYFVRTDYQLADMFTKSFPDDWFKYLVRRIGMRCLTPADLEKQTALAISTTEAEYVSAEKACQHALWMKQALIDYGIRLDDIPIMCDNKGAIDLNKNSVQHSRTKHIEIRHHFFRENVQKGNISIEMVSSKDNIADILTKPLKCEPFNYLRLGLGMMEQID